MIKKIMKNPENKGYLFILPWLIGFVTLTIYPILYSFYLSFFDVTITTEGIQTESVGIENYQSAMTSDIEFINRLIEYVREILISVPLIVIISLLIALLLNQNIRFKGVFRTIFFLPVIISSGPVLDKLIGLDIATLNMVETNALYEMIAGMDNILASSFVYIIDNLIILLWFSGVQILIFNSALQKVDKKDL